MHRLPQVAGRLFARGADGRPTYFGSCFAFGRADVFVTTHHCVAALTAGALGIGLSAPGDASADGIRVAAVVSHPTADLAVLLARAIPGGLPSPLSGVDRGDDAVTEWGARVVTLGYPSDTIPPGVPPAPRLLEGGVQRVFDYDDGRGVYRALELSMPVPAGLSGSPVVRTRDGALIGVVAANHAAPTYRGRFERAGGEGAYTYAVREPAEVRYGVAVSLPHVAGWLEEAVAGLGAGG